MTSPTRALTSRGPPRTRRGRGPSAVPNRAVHHGGGCEAGPGLPRPQHGLCFLPRLRGPPWPGRAALGARAPTGTWWRRPALFVAAKAQGTPRKKRATCSTSPSGVSSPARRPRPWTGSFGSCGTACCSASCCCCGCCASGCPRRIPTGTCCSTCWRWAAGPGVPGGGSRGSRGRCCGTGAAGGLGLRHPPPHLAAAALHLGLELCGRGAPPGTPPRWWQVRAMWGGGLGGF
ncbi:uncharacterized protein LOC141726293 [Zonotrichia albicollis]|uniref:uncharacterized protein LOC141726293 n=1 Tax=Zonotrichia albicollis TaxID=44394 RepID=UPI003D80CB79